MSKRVPVVIIYGSMIPMLKEETEYKPKPMIEIGISLACFEGYGVS